MGKLIAVALFSACLGAGVTFWAKSSVPATRATADATGVRISPQEIMKSIKGLPDETVIDAY